MRRTVRTLLVAGMACAVMGALSSCRRVPTRGRVLALGLAVFTKAPDGRQVPGQATAGFLAPGGKTWRHGTLTDPESNVFHKLLEFCPRPGECGLLSVGGTAAVLKLWRPGKEPQVLWKADFGGRFSRLRDAEVADVLGDGVATIVVGTHDQGVVALVRPDGAGGFSVRELDRQPDTFVHEIEVGDLDGDGVLEIYATPSRPNVLDGTPQPGSIVRYVPARGEGRTVFADLGDRHAKEILVTDMDGDGKDELYASVEAVSGGSVEIRRYRAGHARRRRATRSPSSRTSSAAASRRGTWTATAGARSWPRPRKRASGCCAPEAPGSPWQRDQIAGDSSGFEHAALLADLDEDGRDELYVASDEQHEVRRYAWREGTWTKDVLYRYEGGMPGFTWNLTTVRASLVPPSAWE